MAGRLSETQLTSVLDSGHKSLPWEPGQPSGFLAGIDFNAILESPDAKQIIQSLPPQALYFGLKKKGMEDSLDVLPHLTEDQVTRIVDYDVWYKDRLVPKRAFSFLNFFNDVSSEELYRRFAYLDEEYQMSLLSGLVEIYDLEEFEGMTQEQQDKLYPMPCNEVYYEIKSDDPEVVGFLEKLINSLKEHNLRYTYSILGHASFGLRSENEEAIRRFRVARLEEDGFVTYTDSLSCFNPLDHQELRKSWSQTPARQGAVAERSQGDDSFLMTVLAKAQSSGWTIDEQFEVHQQLLFLSNSLCSASQVEPEDVHGLNRVLEQCRSLVSLGLDYLAQGNPDLGLKILKKEHAKTLFRTGISLVHQLRLTVVQRLESLGLPSIDLIKEHFNAGQWGQILALIDEDLSSVLGFEASEILKGLFNRFPMTPEFGADQQSLVFVPLSSLQKLADLRDYLLGISGLLFLNQSAQGDFSRSLEFNISTSLVNALGGREFIVKPICKDDLEFFLGLSKEELNEKKETLVSFLMTALVDSSRSWDLSYDASVGQGIQKTISVLLSMYRGLVMAKDEGVLPKSLVWMQDS